MNINYKEWNIRNLGSIFILGIVVMLVIGVIHLFVSPLLMIVLPTVFTVPLTLTETLLFLLLLTLLSRRTA